MTCMYFGRDLSPWQKSCLVPDICLDCECLRERSRRIYDETPLGHVEGYYTCFAQLDPESYNCPKRNEYLEDEY